MSPVNTKRLYNIYTTSAQRLRRWSNIVEELYKCFVFARPYQQTQDIYITFIQRRTNVRRWSHLYDIYTTSPGVFDVGSALYKCYTNVLCFLGIQPNQNHIRDAPFDIWGGGGGGLEFLLPANFFFYPRWKTSFFLAINVRHLFLSFVEEFFCHMLSLLCTLPFGVFSGQHIFHQF